MLIKNPNLHEEQKQVIIIGGGFGGLNAAKALANHAEVQVILIDQRNHHLFQPLLYQVATAGLNPSDIAVPIRSQFVDAPNVSVHLARVAGIDPIAKRIHGQNEEELSYDYLILACGARHSYFGKPEWEEFAPGLKTVEQATEIRRRILSAFELAENELDPVRQQTLLTFVIVGGGPTGVELAGAIADISRTVLVRDFRRINPANARILLLEAGPRILAMFSEDLSRRAEKDLRAMGVEVRTSMRVDEIDAEGVRFGKEKLRTHSVFWAAGVQAASITRTMGVEIDRSGRVSVGPDLSIPGHPEAFVIGDAAHVKLASGRVVPGLAPAAIQEGKHAAKNILSDIRGEVREPFEYRDKGQMATVGKRKAIAQTAKLKLTGFVAWLAWLFVHLVYLVGFKNKLAVFSEWAWSYLLSKRGARLITSSEWRFETQDNRKEHRVAEQMAEQMRLKYGAEASPPARKMRPTSKKIWS